MSDDFAVRLTLMDADHLLSLAEWALNHPDLDLRSGAAPAARGSGSSEDRSRGRHRTTRSAHRMTRLPLHGESGQPRTSKHRINVNFSEGAYRQLVDLAERRHKTISDVIRDALALAFWFDQTQRDGGRVLVERNGRAREVEFR